MAEGHKGAREREEEILSYWEANKIFERSVQERPESDPYVFYDGPPFATGLPHYGHIVAGTMKDVVPRYWTMRGRRVERVWGWDCHGLPIENLIEKDLDLGTRDKIEAFGVGKFNEACRARVLEYAQEWEKMVRRMGRWVDMKRCYRTMDMGYMESVWWAFKRLHDEGMLYEGFRPIHICPRCTTTLSASEVGWNYQDVTDPSVTVRFKVVGESQTALLAWTTTPWTLPGNMLLAVGPTMRYIKVKQRNEFLIVAKNRAQETLDGNFEVVEELSASDLAGKIYEPLFPYFADRAGAFRVVEADFVTTEEGTGIVHVAPGFGEDDFAVGQREGLDIVRHINLDGTFVPEVEEFAGRQAKDSDRDIIQFLAGHGLVYMTKPVRHSYPLCWRCDTPLLNFTANSWYIRVADMRDRLLKNNEKTHWVPKGMKDGRFGNWLAGARDWSVSRNRYWGAPLPVWKSPDGDVLCVGSVDELEMLSGVKVKDLHKHVVDEIEIVKDGKTYRRIPEVLDCWFESGSMPFARLHYPFENGHGFEDTLPADFIAEGQDQTRGWFYSLHVLSTLLFDKPAFEHVIVNGLVIAEDGKKMSKRLKNYPDPMEVVDRYGADALRFYLMSSPVTHAVSLRFREAEVKEVANKFTGTLGNILNFYKLFVTEVPRVVEPEELHPLDAWVLSRVQDARAKVTAHMDAYELSPACRELQELVTDVSQWYVRRSRDRFKIEGRDKVVASRVLYRVLEMTARMSAPFTPFMAEWVWRAIASRTDEDSVHLAAWPMEQDLDFKVDRKLLETMEVVRGMVTRALEARMSAKVPVRQVLGSLTVTVPERLDDLFLDIIRDEVNVQKGEQRVGELAAELDITLTPELKRLGLVRELARQGNELRKQAKLTLKDTITLHWESDDADVVVVFERHGEEIGERVKAIKIVHGMSNVKETLQFEVGKGLVTLGL